MSKEIITIERWGNDITSNQDIIGKTIKKIRFNEDYLILEFEDSIFAMSVEGDCCSTSYFYDFYGVDSILNHKIREITSVELDPTDLKASHSGESVEVYGYKIVCDDNEGEYNFYGTSRTGVFSFRNDSNGYYGGYCVPVSDTIDYESIPEITKDVSGV